MVSPRPSILDAARAHAEALFGPGACEPRGVSQICAAVRVQGGPLHVLAIGPHAPKSEQDFFALNLARARSDALLTSSQNLRCEPMLSHRLQGTYVAELEALRAALHKSAPPVCAILSASGNLPREHVAYADGTPKLVLTTREGAKNALNHWREPPFSVVALPELSPRIALSWLTERYPSVSVEAGPRTTGPLYAAPPCIDELLLSRYEGALVPEALGGALPDDATLFHGLTLSHRSEREEESGHWIFERWLR